MNQSTNVVFSFADIIIALGTALEELKNYEGAELCYGAVSSFLERNADTVAFEDREECKNRAAYVGISALHMRMFQTGDLVDKDSV